MAPAYARKHFLVALGDLGFALALFACGLFGASASLTGLAAGAMVAYWSLSRRRVLSRLPAKVWPGQMSIALSVVVAIAAGAYWLGLGVGGFY
jgi:hypothetical protein